ncbi:MAG: sulfatase-like hydrolase/transferase, partial [Armatimonadetes bacterium]|nr:sulfatase-like hydrolase/transferase [Armatimonadota bacterium]
MSRRPNVLLITSDQHHFSCLGSVNAKLQTPALDRLAAEGMRFERAYCNNPVCSPS